MICQKLVSKKSSFLPFFATKIERETHMTKMFEHAALMNGH